MDFETIQHRGAVQNIDVLVCGNILVVDDDRAFGGFMVTALESRGHDVDWAGSLHDGLASLYARRYDLVIIDLRLSDGSGLQLLRDATDERLLAESAAIILTGHDFDAPSDIRVFRKGFELEPFLDRLAEIVTATKRHRYTAREPLTLRVIAFDNGGRPSSSRSNSFSTPAPGPRRAAGRWLRFTASSLSTTRHRSASRCAT